MKASSRIFLPALILSLILSLPAAYAKSAQEIDASVNAALRQFEQEVPGGKGLLKQAKGVLVMPRVVKAGIGIGGEYGEGALRIGGKNKAYYNTVGGSFGFQLGAQMKNIYLLFMEDHALKEFQAGEGWKAGVDGSVALVSVGANGQLDSNTLNEPILGFVIGQKGLMYNLTLEGSKFSRIEP